MRRVLLGLGLGLGACALSATLSPGCRSSKTYGAADGGPSSDAAPNLIDAAPDIDADVTPAGPIQAAKNAADGPVDIDIESAMVTYVKPAVGTEGAGFFVQIGVEGPALFIAVDPDSVEPNPAPGDEVAFTITEMGTDGGGVRKATQISSYSRVSQGNSLEAFVQSVTSASDLVTALADYDSELIEITATLTTDFSYGGSGHQRADIATTGLPASDMLAIRLPDGVVDDLILGKGCTVTLRGIMWSFSGTAEPSGWVDGDLSNVACADPRVVSAVAASATSALVIFDRPIDAGSVIGDGSQFTIGGLAVSAASADGNRVTLTTAAQTGGADYTVTVASSVEDIAGAGVDPDANTATFSGYVDPATVVINEVNANIENGCDLIELRALTAGGLGGLELWQRSESVYTFPEMSLSAGDLVVVHLGTLTNCNPSGAANETTSTSAAPAASHPQNYDDAFDIYTDTGGLTATSNVLTLVDPVGDIVEAVLLHNDDPAVASTSEDRADDVAEAGEWTDTSGMVPAGGFVDADFISAGVPGLAGTSTGATGTSIQRVTDGDGNDKDDWSAAPAAATWGAPNAGQATP